jgi:hypothetical protein
MAMRVDEHQSIVPYSFNRKSSIVNRKSAHNSPVAKALTPIGILAKFIAVPAALAALGYFAIGPRMDSLMPTAKNPEPEIKATVSAASNKKEQAAPDVEVSSKPAGTVRLNEDRPSEDRPSKRRKRSNPVPIETVPIKREEPKNPAEHTGEGVSSEDPNSVDPAKEPPKEEPAPEPDPASTGGGEGEPEPEPEPPTENPPR